MHRPKLRQKSSTNNPYLGANTSHNSDISPMSNVKCSPKTKPRILSKAKPEPKIHPITKTPRSQIKSKHKFFNKLNITVNFTLTVVENNLTVTEHKP